MPSNKLSGFLAVAALATAGVVAYSETVTSLVARRNSRLLEIIKKKQLPDEKWIESINEAARNLRQKNLKRITIRSNDGLTLIGHWYPAENAKRTVIAVHGWHGSWYRDFGSSSDYFHSLGCNMLYVEQRSHGDSEGEFISYGIKERFDILEWLKVAKRLTPELPIYLSGISMGATTVLMASEFLKEGEVAGITADCGFTSPYDIVKKCIEDALKSADLTMAAVNTVCRIHGGFSLKDACATEAVKHSVTPTVFFHGEEDGFVPCEMSRINYENCAAEKELYTFPDADHGMSYLIDTDRYKSIIEEFFRKHD